MWLLRLFLDEEGVPNPQWVLRGRDQGVGSSFVCRDPVDEVVCLSWTPIKFYPVECESLFCVLCVCPHGTAKQNSDLGSRSFMKSNIHECSCCVLSSFGLDPTGDREGTKKASWAQVGQAHSGAVTT